MEREDVEELTGLMATGLRYADHCFIAQDAIDFITLTL
jgi:hypothetical protein